MHVNNRLRSPLSDTRQVLTSWKHAEEASGMADLPKCEAITQALKLHSRQPVRAYLEEFAITKRQYPSQC
jgi:hypothetical protein